MQELTGAMVLFSTLASLSPFWCVNVCGNGWTRGHRKAPWELENCSISAVHVPFTIWTCPQWTSASHVHMGLLSFRLPFRVSLCLRCTQPQWRTSLTWLPTMPWYSAFSGESCECESLLSLPFSESETDWKCRFTISVVCNRQYESHSFKLHNQGSEEARHGQRKVFIILYFTQSGSQCRAHKQQPAVDFLPAGQTSDSGGSRLQQSMLADYIRHKVQRLHWKPL